MAIIKTLQDRIDSLRRSAHYRSCLVEFDLSKTEIDELIVGRPWLVTRRPCEQYPFEIHFAPSTHKMSLNSPWFELVRDGIKTYEGRRMTDGVRAMRVGDVVEFSRHKDDSSELFRTTVVDMTYFSSFKSALEKLGVERVLPSVSTVADGVEIYKKYVSEKTQKLDGVCMLKLTTSFVR